MNEANLIFLKKHIDSVLRQSDWTQLPDSGLSLSEQIEQQELRAAWAALDNPNLEPDLIVLPEYPMIKKPFNPTSPFAEFNKPISAPDFIVSTPKIKDDPLEALQEAVAEMEKGQGNKKSIALIALSQTKYLKHLERQVDKLEKKIEKMDAEMEKLKKKGTA